MKMIINCETGETIERELDTTELEQSVIDTVMVETDKAKDEVRTALRSELLDRLGLTQDEAKLLLG